MTKVPVHCKPRSDATAVSSFVIHDPSHRKTDDVFSRCFSSSKKICLFLLTGNNSSFLLGPSWGPGFLIAT